MPVASTSGQLNTVVVTRDEIILDALQDLGVLEDGAAPSAGDLKDCARKLNFVIKEMAIGGRLLWCLDTIVVPCVANKTAYSIGPQGDIVSYRPLRAFEGTYIRQVIGGANFDTPLILVSRLEYEQFSSKGSLGVPNSFYLDVQMTNTPNLPYSPQDGFVTLRLYNTPVDTSRTVYLKVQRPIQDMLNATDAMDMPLEWNSAIVKALKKEVAPKYRIPLQERAFLRAEAKEAMDMLTDWGATEEAPVSFRPSWRMGYR